jgi:hypothetical protein
MLRLPCGRITLAFTATVTYLTYILSIMPLIIKLPKWLRDCRANQRINKKSQHESEEAQNAPASEKIDTDGLWEKLYKITTDDMDPEAGVYPVYR